MAYLNQIDQLHSKLAQLQPMKEEYRRRLEKKFRMEFNYNSNHLEGNTLTYTETELLLMFEDTTGNHTIREYDEMRAHDVAYNIIENWASDPQRPLTEQDIKQLNEIILVKPFYKDAITPDGQKTRRLIKIGSYKEYPNSVLLQNGEVFEYASPSETPILMGELIDWYRTEENNLHPCTLAAMFHYKFVRIHPFDDGNGRVSRLLMNYILLKNGFPPVVIKSNDKQNYLRALHLADLNDFEQLIQYIAAQLIWSLQISIKAAEGKSIDEPGDLDKKIRELNQKLKIADGKKLKQKKDKTSLSKAFENVFLPCTDHVEDKLSELEAKFRSKQTRLIVNQVPFKKSVGINKVKEWISHHPFKLSIIKFQFSFMGFRFSSNGGDTAVDLIITFHENVYEISSTAFTKVYGKLYDEMLTEAEVTEITEQLGNKIIEQIETLIQPKE